MSDVVDTLMDIATNGEYSLIVNGVSKHLGPKSKTSTFRGVTKEIPEPQRNERNLGIGLLAELDGRFLTAGNYKNSEYNPSYYFGGGFKKRFGEDLYIEPGILGGMVSGYKGGLIPVIMPMVSVGYDGIGAINMMYAPKVHDDPAVLMFNLQVPF